MSLKAFHLFFILVSVALSFGFGVWSLRTPDANRLMGTAAFVLGIALIVYWVWFLKKKDALK